KTLIHLITLLKNTYSQNLASSSSQTNPNIKGFLVSHKDNILLLPLFRFWFTSKELFFFLFFASGSRIQPSLGFSSSRKRQPTRRDH
ncbi:hypothetical protein VIGAN_10150400, partial [Vigna angularis var. angularis]